MANHFRSYRIMAAAVLLAATARPALSQQPMTVDPELRTIRVSATGEVDVRPDLATISLAVETTAPSAKAASEENAERMTRVIDALVAAGVPRDRIDTRGYSIYPQYVRPDRSNPGDEEPRISGYQARNTVSVETTDLERTGPLIDVALGAGANRVDMVNFSLRNPEQARNAALAVAVERARSSAGAIAAALGVQLGAVLDASTVTQGMAPSPVMYRARGVAMDMAEAAPTPIQPDDQTVTAQVTLSYSISGG